MRKCGTSLCPVSRYVDDAVQARCGGHCNIWDEWEDCVLTSFGPKGGRSYLAGRTANFLARGTPMCMARPLLSTFCPPKTSRFVVLILLYFFTKVHSNNFCRHGNSHWNFVMAVWLKNVEWCSIRLLNCDDVHLCRYNTALDWQNW